MRIFFSSIIDASVKLIRSFPLKAKNKTQKTKTKNAESIDLENFKVLLLRNPKKLGFLCDNHFNGSPTNFVNIPYSIQKGR